jgi:hypothetical protein
LSNLLSKAVNNSTWTAIGSLLTAVLSFLFAGLTIRWLGETEAGFAIAVGTIVGINSSFSGLGLGTAATRLISSAYEEKDTQAIQKIAGVCLSTALVFGLLGFCLFAFGSSWIVQWSQYKGDILTGKLYCVMLGLVFLLQQIMNYFDIFLTSLQRYDWKTKLSTTFILANGILGIILLKAFPNILTLGIIQLTLSFLNCLLMGIIVFRLLGLVTYPRWNYSIFQELWSFGKWVYLTQMTGILVSGMDKIFLITFFGSASLPFYTFAQRIYSTVHTMLGGQASYIFPLLSAQGENLAIVAEQVEERMRWIIGLVSSFIYSGLIIAGPSILTIMVNASFSNQASFQLFVFCWVGYIHANGIVQFFIGLSKGDAKGNWIYHMIIALIYLPFFMMFAFLFGFQYAVLGQLMTIFGTIYLSRRLKPNVDWMTFSKWLISPLYSSFLLMFIASIIHLFLNLISANIILQIIVVTAFYLMTILLIFRVEFSYFGGKNRLETLSRAISLVSRKINISDKLIFNLTGIK